MLKSELRPQAIQSRFITKPANYQGVQERSARAGASSSFESNERVFMPLTMAWGGVFSLSAFDAEGMRMDGVIVER